VLAKLITAFLPFWS